MLINQATESDRRVAQQPYAPMAQLNEMKEWLAQSLSTERFQHSLGAQEKALELSRHFQLDATTTTKIALASLLHDAAKLMTPDQLFEFCNRRNMALSPEDCLSPQTIHPFVGAELVRERFRIEDEEVLNAIRYHTTGRAEMDLVEKIVFIADKIEGNTRNPLYSRRVTEKLNYEDLKSIDETMLYILDSTLAFLMEKRQVIHSRTMEARNDFVRRLKQAETNVSATLPVPR